MQTPEPKMVISSAWFQGAILTFVVGFAVLGYLAVRVQNDHPPIPERVVTPSGQTLFTGSDIMAGQHLFQRYGLMELGTIFGHGAYLGPDFATQYMHQAALDMNALYKNRGLAAPDAEARVRREAQGQSL